MRPGKKAPHKPAHRRRPDGAAKKRPTASTRHTSARHASGRDDGKPTRRDDEATRRDDRPPRRDDAPAKREGTQREGAKREGTRREGAQRGGARREGTRREGTQRGGARREGARREGAKREGTKREGARPASRAGATRSDTGRRTKPARRDERPAKRKPAPIPPFVPPVPTPPVLPRKEHVAEGGPRRSGTVALVGRPNVGKSTLLNALVEHPLAIVSPQPQTTRDTLLGVRRVGDAELLFLDTPGLHKASSLLNRAMNRAARGAAEGADVIVFVAEAQASGKVFAPHPGDVTLLADIGEGRPTLLVVNKVDRLRDKSKLLPLLTAFSELRAFEAIIPVSAKTTDGVGRILEEVAARLPEGEHRYGEDDLTDRPARFFAQEYVREQILMLTREEVPHAVAVSIDLYEPLGRAMRVAATIHVEREGQKRIIVGKGGAMLKEIGTRARLRLEELAGTPIRLELFVRVTEGWREHERLLGELGYGAKASGGTT